MPMLSAPRRGVSLPRFFNTVSKFADDDIIRLSILKPKTQQRRSWFRDPVSDLSRERGVSSLALNDLLNPRVFRAVLKSGPVALGIDLAERGIEVRKLFYAAFARGLAKDGYDPEEALQEVYRGILARNRGTCPFDARKSSFGHYVHIVTRCILANWIRKERRRASFESNESSLSRQRAEETGLGYSIEAAPDRQGSRAPSENDIGYLMKVTGANAQVEKALRLLIDGHSRKEVVGRLGVDARWLDGVLKGTRQALQA